MGSFKFIPHTADVGFTARGASLSDLFETCAHAMFSVEYELSTVAFQKEVAVRGEADDLEGLLVMWLSELLFFHDAHGFVPGDFVVVEVGDRQDGRVGVPPMLVRGFARGAEIGGWFEQTGPQLKAVTMHDLSIVKARRGYEATVYLDV